ncbi:MAG: hypothetical protein CMB47_01955 [Euryarchaeota archaeon]|nr:hypothetical protein [Euryarchaeota archaeon]|tara:strand:+ start:17026 stop:17859 length:834 start_codon:yes stop_codon:yes gene_type:complete
MNTDNNKDIEKIKRHGRPGGADDREQDLLYDSNVPTPTHAEDARTLFSRISTATLCTMSINPEGFPYGSFVTFAEFEGKPLFLISALAEHTKNLIKDPKASLMVSEAGEGNPLALGRFTLVGNCTRLEEGKLSEAKEAFVSRHPSARFYIDYSDFFFFTMDVIDVRYIGGFGRMSWITGKDWADASPDPLAEHSVGIIEHMNDDHRDAMIICCKKLSLAIDTNDAFMTGLDRYGFEMSAITNKGPRPIRLGFENKAVTSEDARKEIIKLVKKARQME